MESGVRPRLTAREGRRFALTVGSAFLALGGLAWWREHGLVASSLAAVGTLFLAAGLLVPGRLDGVHRAWMAMALAISRVTTPIFLGLVYLLAFLPTGALMRLFGRDPLRHGETDGGFWIRRPHRGRAAMERQF